LGLILDWPVERVHAALRQLAASRPMLVGIDAEGRYSITLAGRRRLLSLRRADRDDYDDGGDEPNDTA
jgi:hypothetical protein